MKHFEKPYILIMHMLLYLRGYKADHVQAGHYIYKAEICRNEHACMLTCIQPRVSTSTSNFRNLYHFPKAAAQPCSRLHLKRSCTYTMASFTGYSIAPTKHDHVRRPWASMNLLAFSDVWHRLEQLDRWAALPDDTELPLLLGHLSTVQQYWISMHI